MRVLAWNIGRPSPTTLRRQVDAVMALDPDVAFFSEWSPLQFRRNSAGVQTANTCHAIGPMLAESGFVHQCHEHVSDRLADGQPWYKPYWGVLGVSKAPITSAPTAPHLKGAGTWLEITHHGSGLRLVGARQMAWDGKQIGERRIHWEWMYEQFRRLSDIPALVMGDLNTEPSYSSTGKTRRMGADLMSRVHDDLHWSDPRGGDAAEPTYFGRASWRALDHAFVSPAVDHGCRFETALIANGVCLAGPARSPLGERLPRLSDHAPIIVDIEVP